MRCVQPDLSDCPPQGIDTMPRNPARWCQAGLSVTDKATRRSRCVV